MPDSPPPAGPTLLTEALAALRATGREPTATMPSGDVVALAFRLGLMASDQQRAS